MMVNVENLEFRYNGFKALNEISFQLEEGSVTALVGPNGAGKSTLMRCLASLSEPFSGSIYINDVDILTHPQENHKQTGYLSDFFGLYDNLTVYQHLEFMAHAHKVANSNEHIDYVVGLLKLENYLNAEAKSLSRGWRQRLGMAMAMIHKPSFLVLDEPASGLDPEARILLSELFVGLRNKGFTLLVSSHILAELEDYSTNLLVIHQGRIVDHKSLNGSQTGTKRHLKLTLSETADRVTDILFHFEGLSSLTGSEVHFEFYLEEGIDKQQKLLKQLVLADIPVLSLEEIKVNLQEEYLKTIHNR